MALLEQQQSLFTLTQPQSVSPSTSLKFQKQLQEDTAYLVHFTTLDLEEAYLTSFPPRANEANVAARICRKENNSGGSSFLT
jgi:hypothetical protein